MMIKPILFNTEMVRAILDGRKTVTRRVVKPQHLLVLNGPYHKEHPETPDRVLIEKSCDPPYNPGDILYVRETWNRCGNEKAGRPMHYEYRADCENPDYFSDGFVASWRPSIHMPKEAARIFLRVTDVRVERLQDMTEDDVCKEGAYPLVQCPLEHPIYGQDGTICDMCWNTACCGKCEYIDKSCSGKSYSELFGEFVWDRTVKKADLDKYGWVANPFVWVIEFARCDKPEEVKDD